MAMLSVYLSVTIVIAGVLSLRARDVQPNSRGAWAQDVAIVSRARDEFRVFTPTARNQMMEVMIV